MLLILVGIGCLFFGVIIGFFVGLFSGLLGKQTYSVRP